ncbi:MAG: TonB-dependent receptor [Saprospiraceae bacterium]|nr:TonB-dependent receptor [Saprospiraceae bacterium]
MQHLVFYLAVALAFCAPAHAQKLQLAGNVSDEQGHALEGASVFLMDNGKGTATDAEGRFLLDIPAPGSWRLRVSFVGFETQFRTVELGSGQPNPEPVFRLREKTAALEGLIVRSLRANRNTPMTFLNLQQEELSKNNLGQDVPFVLRWTPSVVATSDAGNGVGYTGIRIRGVDPTRINVTINGIPYNDAESQGVFWVNLPDIASSSESIQIQRGVGSSTLGTGAFGATININTHTIHEDPYATVGTSIGSFGTFKRNLRLGSGFLGDKFLFDARLSRITSDGFIDRASADLNSWFLSGAYISDKTTLRLNVFSGSEVTYQAWNGVPADYLNDDQLRRFNSAGAEKPGDPYDNEVDNYSQTHYQLLSSHSLSDAWNLNLGLHWTVGAGYFEQYKSNQFLPDYNIQPTSSDYSDLVRQLWLDNDYYGLTYALNYEDPKGKWNGVLGGGYQIYEGRHFGKVIWAAQAGDSAPGHPYYDNDARKTDFNVYTKWNYALTSDWNAYLDLQLRQVQYDFLGFNELGLSVDQNANYRFFNPKAGLLWQVNPNSKAYASVAWANREPNRNDFLGLTVVQTPKPERMINTEVGWSLDGQKGTLSANVYHMYYKDQLALNGEINNVGEFTRINIDRSYRLGLELNGALQLLPALQWTGSLTLSRNQIIAFEENVDQYDADFNKVGTRTVLHQNTDLAFAPPVIAAMALEYQITPATVQKHDLRMGLQGKYIGRQFIDNTSDANNALDPYAFLDFRLDYTSQAIFGKTIRWNLLVNNVLNARYATNAWSYRYDFEGTPYTDQGFFPQAGVNFLLGMEIDF